MDNTKVITKAVGVLSLANGIYGAWTCYGLQLSESNFTPTFITSLFFTFLGIYFIFKSHGSFSEIISDRLLVVLMSFKFLSLMYFNFSNKNNEDTLLLNLIYLGSIVYLWFYHLRIKHRKIKR